MRKILERRKLPLKFRCLVRSISPLDSAQLTHGELVKYIYETPIASSYFPSQANYSQLQVFGMPLSVLLHILRQVFGREVQAADRTMLSITHHHFSFWPQIALVSLFFSSSSLLSSLPSMEVGTKRHSQGEQETRAQNALNHRSTRPSNNF